MTRILLVGMMGAGKTSVGTALCRRTGWPYYDNDVLVGMAGVETADVLGEHGEAELRRRERAALTAALDMPEPCVAAVAGGVVDDAEDRARLRDGGYVVWLRAGLDTLVERVGSGAGRPWLGRDPRAALERLYGGRAERYAEVASLAVDVDDVSPDDVASLILVALPTPS